MSKKFGHSEDQDEYPEIEIPRKVLRKVVENLEGVMGEVVGVVRRGGEGDREDVEGEDLEGQWVKRVRGRLRK